LYLFKGFNGVLNQTRQRHQTSPSWEFAIVSRVVLLLPRRLYHVSVLPPSQKGDAAASKYRRPVEKRCASKLLPTVTTVVFVVTTIFDKFVLRAYNF
jgi:hypothetical protein